MKINNSNELYIQKIDLLNLIESHIPVPGTIYRRIKKDSISEKDRYKFVKFTDSKEIEFLNSIPWFIDYNDVKDIEEDEIIKMINELGTEVEILTENIKKQVGSEKFDTYVKIHNIRLKIQSLTDILLFKYGRIKMNIPKKIRKK